MFKYTHIAELNQTIHSTLDLPCSVDLDLIVPDEGLRVTEVLPLNLHLCAAGGVLHVCEGGVLTIHHCPRHWVGGIHKHC